MSERFSCERLLRLIAEQADASGKAEVRTVRQLYGPGFEDAWVFARNRFYLQCGQETSVLSLSRVGWLILD